MDACIRLRSELARSIILYETLTLGSAMLISPRRIETAVHGCHYKGDIVLRMRKVLTIHGVVCFLAVTLFERG